MPRPHPPEFRQRAVELARLREKRSERSLRIWGWVRVGRVVVRRARVLIGLAVHPGGSNSCCPRSACDSQRRVVVHAAETIRVFTRKRDSIASVRCCLALRPIEVPE
jgi:hypothetical protein